MTEIPFTKLQGNGNDFVLVDESRDAYIDEEEKPFFAQKVCDRHFGVGGDGVLFLSNEEGLEMRIFNPDGSEAEMCGNGIRCFLKYALESGYASYGRVEVSTLSGDLSVEAAERNGETWVRVDMGEPALMCSDIPAKGEGTFEEQLEGFDVYACGMGVPHAVIFVDDLEDLDVEEVAPEIRFSERFPEGANVNFVEVTDDEIYVRTYERGVEGETQSCGTGATSAAVMAHMLDKVSHEVDVRTRGGPLKIEVGDRVTMEGPAVLVFEGELRKDALPEDRPL